MPSVRAAVFPAPHAPPELRDYPEPELERDSALLRVTASEICGTDVYLHQGLLEGVPYPLIPGHVAVGHLEKIRGTLRTLEGRLLEEGEMVTFLDVHRTCHRCWYCLVARASTRCPERKVYGITYGADDCLAGGWAEKVYLRPGTLVLPLDGADPATFMAGGCGLPTALHAVERADICIGDTVVVLGTGPVGLSAIVLARLRGAVQLLVIGAPEQRLATARDLGADDVLDFRSVDGDQRCQWVRERTGGRGADVVLEATGDPPAVVQGMRMARDAGRVVVVGQYTDHGEVAVNPHLDLNRKHLDVRGCWGSDASHFARAVSVVQRPEWAALWQRIPVQSYGLDRVGEGLDAVARGAVVKALVEP